CARSLGRGYYFDYW
nr:immunoglobulin heavy chain junction region [Mus musculus]